MYGGTKMNISDIKYIEKRLKEIYTKKNIEIISEDCKEFYSICIIINGWKYQYIILKECDSVGEVINYIVNDLKMFDKKVKAGEQDVSDKRNSLHKRKANRT